MVTDLQRVMATGAGVVRDASSLVTVAASLQRLSRSGVGLEDDDRWGMEVHNLLTIAYTVVAAAQARTESRGCHWRADHPQADSDFRLRLVQLPSVLSAVSGTSCASETKEQRR